MKTFESFIENDAFFPILIILLIILIAVFVWIVISNRKAEQLKRAQRQLFIDESAEIKIIDNNHQKVELKSVEDTFYDTDEEPERNEIAIVQEVTTNIDNSENYVDNNDNYHEDKKEEDIQDDSRENEEVKIFVDSNDFNNEADLNDDSIEVPGLFKEEVADIENIDIHLNSEVETENNEVEIPMVKDELNKENEVVDETGKNEEVEEPQMTEEEKAIEDVFALPDFDNLLSEENIEDEIIEAANKYIAEIMSKEDN